MITEQRTEYDTYADDYKAVLSAIFTQAMDDYVKLQHPSYRREKYLHEDFCSAVAMFFDDTYEFKNMQDENGAPMDLQSMVDVLLDGYGRKYKSVRDHLVQTAREFWEKKKMKVIDIPDTVQVDGHVYFVEHREEMQLDVQEGYAIDLDEHAIELDRRVDNSTNQELFVQALVQLLLHQEEISMSREKQRALGRAFFRLLKMNDCFAGTSHSSRSPSSSEAE